MQTDFLGDLERAAAYINDRQIGATVFGFT